MTRLQLAAVAALLSVSQACIAAKEYERPEVDETLSYRTDELPAGASIAEISWREIFKDPLLYGYVREALENNIDIRVAIHQIEIADAYYAQRRAGYVPSVNLSANYLHEEESANSLSSGKHTRSDEYTLSAGVSWEADIWGRIRSQSRAANATYLQTVAAHQAVKSRLVTNIASAYYQLLALDEQVRITTETIKTRENSVETTKALKESGGVTEVGVRQTEAQLFTTQALLVDLQRDVRLLENRLCLLLGRTCDVIARGELAAQEVPSNLRAGVPADLVRNRPDVHAAETAYMHAFELTNLANANLYPTLRITAQGGLDSLSATNFFSPASLFAALGAGLTQPIFQQRKLRTEVRVAEIQQEQALLDFQHALLKASKEVSDALYAYQAASEKIEIKQYEVAAYADATKFSEQLLINGMADYLEVLRAQENMLKANLELVRARSDQLQAIVELYGALGGGWR